MAQAQTFRFSNFRVLLGDGASPEAFTAPCGFTSRGLSFNRELAETNTPSCTDEDAPSWLERDVTSMSATINGEGVLDLSALPKWQALLSTTESTNARVELWHSGAKIGHYEGKFALESMEWAVPKGERVTITVSMQSDGEIAWTEAP